MGNLDPQVRGSVRVLVRWFIHHFLAAQNFWTGDDSSHCIKANTDKSKLPITEEISKTTGEQTVQEIHQENLNHQIVYMQLFSDQRGKMKRDEHIQIVMKTMKLIISYWRRMHTIENSKAEGYIRNNCETQSIHYKIDINTRSLTNNTKLSSKKIKERTCKKFSF